MQSVVARSVVAALLSLTAYMTGAGKQALVWVGCVTQRTTLPGPPYSGHWTTDLS